MICKCMYRQGEPNVCIYYPNILLCRSDTLEMNISVEEEGLKEFKNKK
jgi:hypothetical protein